MEITLLIIMWIFFGGMTAIIIADERGSLNDCRKEGESGIEAITKILFESALWPVIWLVVFAILSKELIDENGRDWLRWLFTKRS